MTLIIAVRCQNGAAVIADRRCRIVESGTTTFDDNYGKIIRSSDALVFNHGYNRIGDRDWKVSASDLVLDENLAVYTIISREMLQKADKTAGYVFLNPLWIEEISINAGQIARRTRFTDDHDRLTSGSGRDYADLSLLEDLQRKTVSEVVPLLESTFLSAHARLVADNGDLFSKAYDLETILA